MKKLLFLFILFSQVLSAQVSRNMLQDYNTIQLLRAETITPKANDKVFVRDSQFIYYWDKNSTISDDGYYVIKQTNQATGRYRLVKSESEITLSNTAPAPLTTFKTKEWIDTIGVDDKRYVWNGTRYILNPTDWHTTGNYGTTPTNNFLGTIDDVNLVFKRNNIQSGLLTNDTKNNTGFGFSTLINNTNGTENTAIGSLALFSNISGNNNTSIGWKSLYNNTLGHSNTSVGIWSLTSNINGMNNVALGYRALFKNTIGGNNVSVGFQCLNDITTGSNNTSLGYNTGNGISIGSNNTIIGANVTGLSTSLSGYIILSDGVGNIRLTANQSGQVGINTQLTQTSTLQVYGNIAIRDTTVTTGNYTMSAGNDPTNVCFKVGASGTINLTAGQVRSREYHLINYSGVSLTFGTSVRTATGATTLILPADEKFIIYWSGTEWIRKN